MLTKNLSFEAVVIGAGPVGIALCNGLQSIGLNVCIAGIKDDINCKPISFKDREIAVSSKSCNLMKDCGLVFNTTSCKIKQIYFGDRKNKNSFLFPNINELQSSNADEEKKYFHLAQNQYKDKSKKEIGQTINTFDIAKVGLKRLKDENVKIFEINDFEIQKTKQKDRQCLSLIQEGFEIKVQAKYIFVCIGKINKNLSELGFLINLFKESEKLIMSNVSHSLDHNGIACENLCPNGSFVLLPLKGGKSSSLSWSAPRSFVDYIMKISKDLEKKSEILDLMNESCPSIYGLVENFSDFVCYDIFVGFADKCVLGNVILVGDTISKVNPCGARGYNSAMSNIKDILSVFKKNKNNPNTKCFLDWEKRARLRFYENSIPTQIINLGFKSENQLISKGRNFALSIIKESSLFSDFISSL